MAAKRLHLRWHTLFAALLVILIAPARGSAAGQEALAKASLQREQGLYQQLERDVKGSDLAKEIKGCVSVPAAEARQSLQLFRPHLKNKSRLDANPAGYSVNKPGKLSVKSRLLIGSALSPAAAGISGHSSRAALMGLASQDEFWNLLLQLEDDHAYGVAALLAQEMYDRAAAGDDQDLLALVAARELWVSSPSVKSGNYEKLIAQASGSANAEINRQARLWLEAVSKPSSFEALNLSHQIWETVYLDLSHREKGNALSALIASCGKAVYERVAQEAVAGNQKQQLVRVASVVSEAAFQQCNRDLARWAAEAVKAFTTVDSEDALAPAYFYAQALLNAGDYDNASQILNQLFMSGKACDVAADAGYRLAHLFRLQKDNVAALACLNMLIELYPGRPYVTPKAISMKDRLTAENPKITEKMVSEYIGAKYHGQLSRARAQLKNTPKVMMAQAQ